MGQRHVKTRRAHGGGSCERLAIEVELGLTGRQSLHFDVLPLHSGCPTCTQRFERGFLCRESRGKMNTRVSTLVAVTSFDFRIYSVEEARAEFLQRFSDALVLNHVNADTNNHRCMLQANRVSQITVLSEPALSAIPGIVHGFSTRRAEHNAFTLGPLSSENPAIQMNRARFLDAVGMTGWPLLKLKQTHSDIVHDFKDTWAASQPVEGDGAITALCGAALGVQTADCVPILIADREARVVAAVHAGWRGTGSRIAENAVKQMTQ